jgi:hypothetical protein
VSTVWGNPDELATKLAGSSFDVVGRSRLSVSEPVLKAPMVSALEAEYDETLSNFAFKFNLGRYNVVVDNNGKDMASVGPVADFAMAAGPARYFSPRHRMPFRPETRVQNACGLHGGQQADFGISLLTPSAHALPATLYGHSTWRPHFRSER